MQCVAHIALGRHYARFWENGQACVRHVSETEAMPLVLTHNLEWALRDHPFVVVEPLTWEPTGSGSDRP